MENSTELKRLYDICATRIKAGNASVRKSSAAGRPVVKIAHNREAKKHFAVARKASRDYFKLSGKHILPQKTEEDTVVSKKNSLIEASAKLMSQQSIAVGHHQTINESRKVDHEADFHSAWKSRISTLEDSKSATAPAQRNLLNQVSQAHLHLAQLHAAMHYNRHGKPIKVSGNDYDEFISAQKNPLVVKK